MLHWLPDGRLIYVLAADENGLQDSSLWMFSLQQSRKISRPSKRITHENASITQINGTADGKTLTFLRENRAPSASCVLIRLSFPLIEFPWNAALPRPSQFPSFQACPCRTSVTHRLSFLGAASVNSRHQFRPSHTFTCKSICRSLRSGPDSYVPRISSRPSRNLPGVSLRPQVERPQLLHILFPYASFPALVSAKVI